MQWETLELHCSPSPALLCKPPVTQGHYLSQTERLHFVNLVQKRRSEAAREGAAVAAVDGYIGDGLLFSSGGLSTWSMLLGQGLAVTWELLPMENTTTFGLGHRVPA